MHMSDEINIPDIQEYVSIKDAAKMLNLAYTTVHEYVSEGRIPAVRAADVILIPLDEVKKFKPNISGRPRKSIPIWRTSPEDNTLLMTLIHLHVRTGQQDALREKLEEIKQNKQHLFPGTVARYVASSKTLSEMIEIILIWRSSVMPDDATREQALEMFRQTLAEELDWSTAQYNEGVVMMHT
jgi:excisionase family DNA binding protein